VLAKMPIQIVAAALRLDGLRDAVATSMIAMSDRDPCGSQVDEAIVAVFFYGLFMDAELLRARGIAPRATRVVSVADHVICLGIKAMLLPAPNRRAWGVLHVIGRREFDCLYANLQDYLEVTVLVQDHDGSTSPAVAMIHRDPPVGSAEDPAYAVSWRALAMRLRLPNEPEVRLT
jgi:hypothetical protein